MLSLVICARFVDSTLTLMNSLIIFFFVTKLNLSSSQSSGVNLTHPLEAPTGLCLLHFATQLKYISSSMAKSTLSSEDVCPRDLS